MSKSCQREYVKACRILAKNSTNVLIVTNKSIEQRDVLSSIFEFSSKIRIYDMSFEGGFFNLFGNKDLIEKFSKNVREKKSSSLNILLDNNYADPSRFSEIMRLYYPETRFNILSYPERFNLKSFSLNLPSTYFVTGDNNRCAFFDKGTLFANFNSSMTKELVKSFNQSYSLANEGKI